MQPRFVILALPCYGTDDAARVQDFIKSTGMTDTEWNFDVVPVELHEEVSALIEKHRTSSINPTEDFENNED